ncbi:MAG: TetR/AcrR family transcriptional regulator [Dorea sp.]|nr:TetR/AcrR family transcriptional regulator [Dorea sp.]
MRFILRPNHKTRFTRKCIAEAIVILLQGTPFEKLRVSAIIKKAGISRMTFYKYYDSPKAALIDYLQIMISEYVEEDQYEHTREVYRSYEHILYSIQFFDRYANFFLTLSRNGLHYILLDGINQFMTSHVEIRDAITIYEIYAYAGGLLNTFLLWEESEKRDSAEEVAKHLFALYGEQ